MSDYLENYDPDAFTLRSAGLLVFDVVETHRAGIEEADVIGPLQRLIAGCRTHLVPVFFAGPNHRTDGLDFAQCLTDATNDFAPHTRDNPPRRRPRYAQGSKDTQVIEELEVRPEDYVIRKHRWNAFYQTNLDLSLRTRGIDTIFLVGGAVHVGIASTLYGARDMDYQVIVLSDACYGRAEQRDFMMEKIFPRVCRIRTVNWALRAMAKPKIDE